MNANRLLKTSNVIELRSREEECTTVNEMVNLVISDLKEASESTAKNYYNNYKEFFREVVGKDIEFVNWEDVENITYSDVMKYRNSLKDVNVNKTINIKIASLMTLFKHLKRENSKIDIGVVNVDNLPEREEDAKQYGSLTEEEVKELIEYCEDLPLKQKPLVKKMFFKLAFVTAIRVNALLRLTWKDIKEIDDGKGNKIKVIEIRDKGKLDKTPITDELYKELLDLKNVEDEYTKIGAVKHTEDSKILQVGDKTLRKTLKDFCELVAIDEERNIVLHSLKKASLDKVYSATNNINLTARHGHHSGIEMVYKHYEGKNELLVDRPSYSMFDKEINVDSLENLSKEELLAAISKCTDSTINEILSKVK